MAHFANLRVYRLSESLADRAWGLSVKWNSFARDTVGKQLVRAADSIGANIAEGSGRGSFKDNRRFVKTARASLYETQHWLRRAYRRTTEIEELKQLLRNLAPNLNAYLKSIGPSPNPSDSPKLMTNDQ